MLYALLAVVIIGLVVNVFKKRSFYFMLSFVIIISAVIIIITSALCMRSLRTGFNPSKMDTNTCMKNLSITGESSIKNFCQRKYLPHGETCTKLSKATYWELDNSSRDLDPSACVSATGVLYWNLFLAGFWVFMAFGFLCILAATCFFLSDTSEFLGISYNNTNFIMVIGMLIGLVLVAGGIFGIFYLGRNVKPDVNPWVLKSI